MRRGAGVLITLACALLGAAPGTALAAPEVQAHRGGSFVNGTAAFPENTMPAFEHAAANGWTIELDVTRTRDGIVVLHDPTLDRTTVCSGPARFLSTQEIRAWCPSDVLGSPGSSLGGSVDPATRVPVPTLDEVLALARRTGARLSVEIKNVPTESDFDLLKRAAFRVVDAIKRSGLPPSQLVVQSFWPPNLDVVELLLPKVPTALLTLTAMNEGGPAVAALRGYEWFSPGWPASQTSIDLAHLLGRRVVPYTLNTPATVAAAAAAGVDAVITDDPPMAVTTLG